MVSLHAVRFSDTIGQFPLREVSHTPRGNDFVAVTMGVAHACGLHEDGTLTCWGHGTAAELPKRRGEWMIPAENDTELGALFFDVVPPYGGDLTVCWCQDGCQGKPPTPGTRCTDPSSARNGSGSLILKIFEGEPRFLVV